MNAAASTDNYPYVVLVVDDEGLLRMLAADIVEEAGYSAVEARNADEAIAILERRSDIGMLITDVNMPGKFDGIALAHITHERWPSVGIMIVSGRVRPDTSSLPTGSQFMSKPFDADKVIAEIRSTLASDTPH